MYSVATIENIVYENLIVKIIVVLVALVAIFKDSIKSLVEKILKKVTDNANKI